MKQLRKNTPYRLAFVGDSGANGFFRMVHQGFRNFCQATDEVEECRINGTSVLTENALNYVRPDGVIGIFCHGPARDTLRNFTLPTVNISHALKTPAVPSVTNDDSAIGKLAATTLLRDTNRHLGVLSFPNPWLCLERAASFRREVRRKGRGCHGDLIRFPPVPPGSDFTLLLDSRKKQIHHFLSQLTPPASVFCPLDGIANLLMDTALDFGWKIPGDLKILGCDNNPSTQEDSSVPLSSIELAGKLVGWKAAEKLLKYLKTGQWGPNEKIPPIRVVERLSTGRENYSPLIRKATATLRRDFRQPLAMDNLARELGASRRKLETLFLSEVGHSPYDFLLRIRLERACELLSQNQLSITEIAYESGFNDFRSLGTAFRRHLSISPRDWRKVYRDTFR